MSVLTPRPEIVVKGLLDCLAGRASGLTVGVDRAREGTRAHAVTPFGIVFGPEPYERARRQYGRSEGAEVALATAAHAFAHVRLSTPFHAVEQLEDLSLAVISLLEDERVERRLAKDVPGLEAVFVRRFDPAEAAARIGAEGALARVACALKLRKNLFGDGLCEKALALLESVEREGRDFRDVRAAGSVLANDLGQLRYVFDRSAYAPWPCYRDDNSILWSNAAAPSVVHEAVTRDPVTSRPPSAEEAGSHERRFLYDEWDYREDRYRTGHTTVLEIGPALAGPSLVPLRPSLAPASRWLPRPSLKGRRRFLDAGEVVDLDRAIERSVDLACGVDPMERIFDGRNGYNHRFATFLLLDASESANDRIAGTVSTILDQERPALRHLSTLLAEEAMPFAVYSFQSNTRERVTVRAHKGVIDRWSTVIARDIATIRANHSTRMGTAIRLVGAVARTRVDRGLDLVLTDGQPSDIDAPDGVYMIEDTRRPVDELRTQGLAVLCLGIGAGRDETCDRMFGRSYVVHARPEGLRSSLVALVRQIRTVSL